MRLQHLLRHTILVRDYLELKRQAKGSQQSFPFGKFYPCLDDRYLPIETASGHYFHQDLLVAHKIFVNNPKKHVDVGSRMDGFVAHVASFRQIEVFDVRPLESSIPNISFKRADFMSGNVNLRDYCDSVSSLHAIEHFGLGRYGDKIDYHGHLKGFDNIYKMLREAGKFYFSVPIGRQRIEFNAHRVFSLKYLMELFEGKYRIDSFSYVNDKGDLVTDVQLNAQDIENNYGCYYGCGVFELTKVTRAVSVAESDRAGLLTGYRRPLEKPAQGFIPLPHARLVSSLLMGISKLVDKWIKMPSTRLISKLLNRRYVRPLKLPTHRDLELLEDLRKTFRKIPYEATTNCPWSEKVWKENMNHLRELVLKGNPMEFLRWDVILGTMFVCNDQYIITELNHLKGRPDWENRWCKAIEEVAVGHPIPFNKYPRSSGNLIHHAYHISQFEEKTGLKIETTELVFEFGGGYGSKCRLLYNLGFKGKYVIFDFPHFTALQRYYLKSIEIPVYSFDRFQSAESGVVCISDFEDLKDVIFNHIDRSNSLFIATWSISETPLNLRNSILSLTPYFNSFLIAYQDRFGEMNNTEYFTNYKANQGREIRWHQWRIKHLPGNQYLVGTKFTN